MANQSRLEIPLIFVYLGDDLPDYAVHSLKFAVNNSGCPVVLLASATNVPQFDVSVNVVPINSFYDSLEFQSSRSDSLLDPNFWDGFWLKTTERFFVLREYVTKIRLNRFFHAELDNLVFSLKGISDGLDQVGNGIFIPRDDENRAIASLLYVNDSSVLALLCDFSTQKAVNFNDMEMLASFLQEHPERAFGLPTSNSMWLEDRGSLKGSFTVVDEQIMGIFDGASFGQWLFGIDPRITGKIVRNRFINEKLRYDPRLLSFRLDLHRHELWVKWSGTDEIRLHNLHVHSKIHRRLSRTGALERFIAYNNKGKSVVISLNPFGAFRYFLGVIVYSLNFLTNRKAGNPK